MERQQVFLLAQDPSLCTLRVRLAAECVKDILHWVLPNRTDVQFVRWCWHVAAARTFSGRAGRLGTVLLHMLVLFLFCWAMFGALCGPSWSRPGTKLVLPKANFRCIIQACLRVSTMPCKCCVLGPGHAGLQVEGFSTSFANPAQDSLALPCKRAKRGNEF